MIVRIALWHLDDTTPPIDELRDRLDELAPLPPPSTFLVNEGAERIGVFVLSDEDVSPPPQLDELRVLVGRDPDLYEEFDAL